MSATPQQVVHEGFEVSPQQRRIWRLNAQYKEWEFGAQCTIRMRNGVDVTRLNQSIARTRSQLEIMRTTFALLEGTTVPVQVVNGSESGLDAILDLRGKGPEIQSIEMERCRAEQWARLRTLRSAPAFAFVLQQLSDVNSALLITASGACGDASSLANLARRLYDDYFETGNTPENDLQYADLSEWQNQILSSVSRDQALYWEKEEFSALAFPRLPFEHCHDRRHTIGERAVDTRSFALAQFTTTVLAQMAHDCGATLPTVLLCAWCVVLKRFTGLELFLVGVGLTARAQEEIQNAVGPFAKTLPVAMHMDEGLRFRDLVEQTHNTLRIAQYDQIMFDWRSFGAPGNLDRRHLFPLVFTEHHLPALPSPGGFWHMESLLEQLEPADMAFAVITAVEETRCEFCWDREIYSREDASGMIDCLLSLLNEITAQPDCRINELTMMDVMAAHPQRAHRTEASLFRPVHEMIEEQCRRVPEQIALVYDDAQLTYAELDHRASALTRRLQQEGVTSDSVVAIIAERSLEFFVGMLAVLKCGGAWLPIESGTPAERIQFMLAQGSAVAILARHKILEATLPTYLPVVDFDEWKDAGNTGEPKKQAVAPNQLAYVIFTSGSTGQPKGVGIEHGQLTSYVQAIQTELGPGSCRNFALISTVAADLGHTAVFAALTTGGCLHVISPSRASDGDALAHYLVQNQVDFIKIVPGHMEALCRAFPEDVNLAWKKIVSGGEQLTWEVLKLVDRVAPGATVINHYGPTETTVGVLCNTVSWESRQFLHPGVPIGHALPGVRAYVLDEFLRPVPRWVPGELYIGGDSVGRGYLGRGDLTAERFIPDPFRGKAGARMYRTGDVVRGHGDGAIEFLGRKDGQVKIRGYRVELTEIEAALCRHPQVQRAVVTAVDDSAGQKQLKAWVAVGMSKIGGDDLKTFLSHELPHYMIPGIVICVKQLKLTANGKVDRNALPQGSELNEPGEVGPADELEEILAGIWQRVLGVERVRVTDGYFALGGDSLRVIQMVHEARRHGINISSADLLRYQTVRRLRGSLRDSSRQQLFPEGVPALPPSQEMLDLPSTDIIDVYPIAGMQSFILGKYALSQGSEGIYHIQDCIHMKDPGFAIDLLQQSFQAVVDRHPVLRTVFDLRSHVPRQWVRQRVNWNLEVVDISHLAVEAQKKYLDQALPEERSRLFDPNDPEKALFRLTIYLRSSTEFDFAFSCHHAIMDGWGHRVLMNQFLQAYSDLKSGRKVDLGSPDSSYREFVTLHQAVTNSSQASHFWQSYLSGLAAPTLRESASAAPPEQPAVVREIGPEFADALIRAASTHSVSMQALMLSSWFDALRDWSQQETMVVGVVMNGRSELLTDPLSAVGLFWNIVPVVSRKRTEAQIKEVQRDLVEIAPFSTYSLPRLLADRNEQELFFSVFRYLHFWNVSHRSEESGLEILETRPHDRYSFPLDLAVLLNADKKGGLLILQYDPAKISEHRAAAALDGYFSELGKVSGVVMQPELLRA